MTKKPTGYKIGQKWGGFLYRLYNIPTLKKHYKEIKKIYYHKNKQ